LAQQSLAQSSGAQIATNESLTSDACGQPHFFGLGRIASRIVLAAALLAIAAAGALYAFRLSYSDQVYPGVHVAGIDLGGMTHGEAKAALQAKADEIEGTRAYFDAFGSHWAPTLRELGVTVNVDTSVDRAVAIGREDESKDRINSALSSLRDEEWLPLQITVSSERLEAWAAQVDADIDQRPENAELSITDGEVSIEPERNGTVVNRLAIQDALLAKLRTLEAPTMRLPIQDDLPTVYVSDFDSAKATIEAALSAPVDVSYGDKKWTVDAADFGNFIDIVIDPSKSGSAAISVEVNERELANWLADQFGSAVNKDPKNSKVAWSGKKLIEIEPSEDGARMLPSSLAEKVASSFLGDHQPVEIPVSVLQPEINGNNLDTLGITTKLGVGSSNFDGSDDARATNIEVGAGLLNGTLIPPHGEFSFNHAIGAISSDLGYVDAQVVDGEYVGRDVGGGICQVSTTVYRAALYSGVPITEWWPHRWRLGFYELDDWTLGLDASILQPEGDPFGGGDFKFMNPSDSWMLVESYVEWPRVYVVIYGPDLGYDVQISEPVMGESYDQIDATEIVDDELPPGTIKQSEWAAPGQDVTYYRTVYDRDGNVVLDDVWETHFYPRGDVYNVSPDMQGLSPASSSS
jgi:vancomycin resistance protein YoaR